MQLFGFSGWHFAYFATVRNKGFNGFTIYVLSKSRFRMSTPMEIDLPAGTKASGKAKETGKKRFEVKKV